MPPPNAPAEDRNPEKKSAFRAEIGFFGLTMIAAGSCIGSGIFISPSDVAGHLPDATSILLVWTLGGIVAITGSLTFAELAGRFPGAGGVYLYLRECYGQICAFLYGWCILTVITSGAIAALSLTFARYVNVLIPMSTTGQLITAISAIASLTWINILGVRFGELFTSVFTVFKLTGILLIVVAGILIGQAISDPSVAIVTSSTPTSAYALAMIGVLWSFGGWHHASYVAAEVKSPTRIVPRAMITGALIVTVTYLLTNWSYLRVLGAEGIASSSAVASDALGAVHPAGAIAVSILIALSTFGSIGVFTLTAPRIYYSMARDGAFLRSIAKLHPRYNTPARAILIQSGWAVILLLFWSTFENLMTYVVFMDWVFMTLAAIAVIIFRKRFKSKEYSGFRVPLYPLVPTIFIAISLWFVAYTLIGRPGQAWAGILLLCAGLPVYFLSKRKEG